MSTNERPVILRAPDVAAMLNISVESLYRWMRIGRFPRGSKYGERLVGWNRATVEAWIAEKMNPSASAQG